ncbi:MAG: hypothetical protein GY811_21450 [Myxococcales bacterium]|nr:hypothetical protein [Myxococcales bacterium]
MKLVRGPWGRKHFVSARCETQALGFLEALAPLLSHYSTVRMSDEHLSLERSDSGLRRRRLGEYVASVRDIAQSLGQARGEIPAAPEFAETFDRWSQFAASLGSAIEPGDMSIEGSYQGVAVQIQHQWLDGILRSSTIGVAGLAPQDSEDCFVLKAAGDDVLGAEDYAELAEGLHELLAPALIGAMKFSSEEKADYLQLPPQIEPGGVKTRLAVLARYSSSRATTRGPYR